LTGAKGATGGGVIGAAAGGPSAASMPLRTAGGVIAIGEAVTNEEAPFHHWVG